MKYNVLYIRKDPIDDEISHLGAKKLENSFEVSHPSLSDMVIRIFWIPETKGLYAIAKSHHLDLIVYDERPIGSLDATEAIASLSEEYQKITKEWGNDFLTPSSKMVAVLRQESAQQAFYLGQHAVKEICVDPKSLTHLLIWLKRLLEKKIFKAKKLGLTLAGGGLEGFLYQLGCIYCLKEAFGSLDQVEIISGISCGAMTGVMIAADLDIEEVIKSLDGRSEVYEHISTRKLYDFGSVDFFRRLLKPQLSLNSLNPNRWMSHISKAWPTGVLKGDLIEAYFRKILKGKDSFLSLKKEFMVGTTDQDSFEHVLFDKDNPARVSDAIRASIAIPPIFKPKKIDGRYYIDGQVTRTSHLQKLVDKGCSTIIIINPLKPTETLKPGYAEAKGGLYTLTQMLKAMISSRFRLTMNHINERYPNVDFMLFEPNEECAHAMQGLPMRFKLRQEVTEMAVNTTASKLLKHYDLYKDKLAKLDIKICSKSKLTELKRFSLTDLK